MAGFSLFTTLRVLIVKSANLQTVILWEKGSGNLLFTCSARPNHACYTKASSWKKRGNLQVDYHWAEALVDIGQLGQRSALGSETGQQEVRHWEFRCPLSKQIIFLKTIAGGPPGRPICRERHLLQTNRRRWPGPLAMVELGRVSLHRAAAALGVRGGGRRPVGGGMPRATSGSARLRAVWKVPRTGGWAARFAAQTLTGFAAPGAGLGNGAAVEAGGAWLGGGPQAACWLSQVSRSSGPWKSSRATKRKRVSSALRGMAWMRACWLGVRAPQKCSSKRRVMAEASVCRPSPQNSR